MSELVAEQVARLRAHPSISQRKLGLNAYTEISGILDAIEQVSKPVGFFDAVQVAGRLRKMVAHWEKNAVVARQCGHNSEASQWNACAGALESLAEELAPERPALCCPNCGRSAKKDGDLVFSCRMGWCHVFVRPVAR